MSSLDTTGSSGLHGRRNALKKMGKAGAFILPAIATFKLTELSVRASGYQDSPIDCAWKKYWLRNKRFLWQSERYWARQKERWFRIWSFLHKNSWI